MLAERVLIDSFDPEISRSTRMIATFVAKYSTPCEAGDLVQTFHRSPLIYRKHNTVELYRLDNHLEAYNPGPLHVE